MVDILTGGNYMRLLRPNLKLGIYAALATVFSLIFIPPLIAPYLDEWRAAQEQLSQMRIHERCSNDGQIKLSPWFYSFNVSGGAGKAKFNGSVVGVDCEKSFTVHLIMINYVWKVSDIAWN
jgi:hypothetical protein